MIPSFDIKPPFFEFGPKAYLYGQQLLQLAHHADRLSVKYDVRIIITPQYSDISILALETEHLLVFAQHMDSLPIGRGIGSVLPEAVKAAGADGVMLNHAEKPLSLKEIANTVQRADEVGLASMICTGMEGFPDIIKLHPNILLVEEPSSIGTGERTAQENAIITKLNQAVRDANHRIHVLYGAGITDGKDVYNVIAAGAEATGSTSGIIKAEDPFSMFEEMIRSVRQAWDDTH